jgi:integrase
MRGTGSVWQRADGVWCAAISLGSVNGRRVRETMYGPTEDAVRERLYRAQLLIGTGHDLPSKVPLGDYLASWIDAAGPDLAPRTEAGYRTVIAALPDWLSAVQLGRLNGGHVQAWVDTLEGSPRTVAWKRNTLRAALNEARRRGLVERNAAALARVPRQKRPSRPSIAGYDCMAILAACCGWRYRAAAAIAIGCGLRQGELLGLAWSDLADGRITVRVGLRRVPRDRATGTPGEYVLTDPKTDASAASVPVPAFVLRHLAVWDALQAAEWAAAHGPVVALAESRKAGLMFTTPTGMPVNGTVVTHQFQARLEAAGLTVIPWHALRHATADLLADAGVGQTVARDYLRHASYATTADHYTGSSTDALALAAAALDRAMGE